MGSPSAGGTEMVNIVGGGQFPKITAKSTDDFEVGVTLGTGSFGRVRFATHKVMWWSKLATTQNDSSGHNNTVGNQNPEEE